MALNITVVAENAAKCGTELLLAGIILRYGLKPKHAKYCLFTRGSILLITTMVKL